MATQIFFQLLNQLRQNHTPFVLHLVEKCDFVLAAIIFFSSVCRML